MECACNICAERASERRKDGTMLIDLQRHCRGNKRFFFILLHYCSKVHLVPVRVCFYTLANVCDDVCLLLDLMTYIYLYRYSFGCFFEWFVLYQI